MWRERSLCTVGTWAQRGGSGHLTRLWSGALLFRTDRTPGRGPLAPAAPHTWSHFLDGSSQNHCKNQQRTYLSKLLKDRRQIVVKALCGAAAAAKSLQSCPTLCNPIDGSPPGSPIPGILPGKNTGVGCHFLLQCVKVTSESEVAQPCPTLSNPVDRSPPGSSVHGIFQARVLECVAIAFSVMWGRGWLIFQAWAARKQLRKSVTCKEVSLGTKAHREGLTGAGGNGLWTGPAGLRTQWLGVPHRQLMLREGKACSL